MRESRINPLPEVVVGEGVDAKQIGCSNMNMEELQRILLAVCPTGQVEWDNENQIIFYTGLTDAEDGTLSEINTR